MLVAGVDYDTFGVYAALVDARDFSLSDLVVLRYRDKSRQADASYAFPAARALPTAVYNALYEQDRRPVLAFVERAYIPRGQLRQAFALGRVQGLVVAGLLDLGVIVEELTPAEWRKELGVPGNCAKAEAHLALAERYPDADDPRLRDENVRDALAIAYAGVRRNKRDLERQVL